MQKIIGPPESYVPTELLNVEHDDAMIQHEFRKALISTQLDARLLCV